MPLATDADVRALVEMEPSISTAPFIASAAVVTEEMLVGKGLSTARLTQIEIFLAAHFATLAVERGGITKETYGSSSDTYREVKADKEGFSSTRFGQQALAMDTSGTLADAGRGALKAQFRVVSPSGLVTVDRTG